MLHQCFIRRCLLNQLRALRRDGETVYPSLAATTTALQCIRASKPLWFNTDCEEFVRRVEQLSVESKHEQLTSSSSSSSADLRFPLICVEGLDGVGKTTVTKALVERLNHFSFYTSRDVVADDSKIKVQKIKTGLFCTPSADLEPVRQIFRVQDESIARAFYCAGNYLISSTLSQWLRSAGPVVMDRWWASTCAMSLGLSALQTAQAAKKHTLTDNKTEIITLDELLTLIPPKDSLLFHWPQDLTPRVDLGILLDATEEIRLARVAKRQIGVHVEERLLAEQNHLRKAVMECYQRVTLERSANQNEREKMFSLVHVHNYKFAVNEILRRLQAQNKEISVVGGETRRLVITDEAFYSEEEVNALAPY